MTKFFPMKISTNGGYKFLLMFLAFISVSVISAQQLQDSTRVSPIEGLEQGNFFLSAGFNFNELVTKNNDEFIFYILDDSNTRYNVKLGSGYMVEDMRSVGVGFRYFYDKYEVTYENAGGDTIRSTSRSTKAIGNIFYGISKPIFDS